MNIFSPQEEDCILWMRKVVMEKHLDNLGFLDLNPNTNHASVSQRSIPATPLTLNVKRMEKRLDMIYNIEDNPKHMISSESKNYQPHNIYYI